MGVAVTLLGPFGVECDGNDVTPRSVKAQALLASLAVRGGIPVAADTLVEELWPDLPADRGRRVLQVRMAEIRKQLSGAGATPRLNVESSVAGYRLAAPADALDSARFVGFVQRAEAHTRRGDVGTASTLLREGLGLWRGEALAGIQVSRHLETAAAELEELRLSAIEERVAPSWPQGATSASSASWRRWWPPIRCGSGCGSTSWSRCTARAARRRRCGRARPCAGTLPTRSVSTPARGCASWRPPSSPTTRRSTSRSGQQHRPPAT